MATSGAMSTSNQFIKYTISITQNSQSVTNNTSNVTVKVRFYRTNTGYTSYGTGTVYCKINGTTFSASVTPSDKITSSGIVLFTKTLNISHATDGSKKLTCSAWIKHDVVTSSEQSYTQTLTTIPRASTFSASATSVNIGDSVTFTMSRASSAFTHKLTYKFGSTTGTIGTDIGTSKAWTVPDSLATVIPNATSGTCTITCTTYNGGTSVGSKTLTLTLKVKSTVIPTVTFTVTEAVDKIASTFGVFVKSLSKLKITATGAGAGGSTIKSYKISANGATYNDSSATTGLLKSTGSMTVTVTVTDSRGRTGSTDKTITVYDYSAPYIDRFIISRCDSDGTLNDEGSSVSVDLKAGVSDVVGKNSGDYTLRYNVNGEDDYTEIEIASDVLSYETTSLIIDNIDTEKTYEFRLVISDAVNTFTGTLPVNTAFTLVDYNESGRGMSIGKVSEKPGALEIALQTYFKTPPIIGSENKILWEGAWYMNATQIAELSEAITSQMSGVILVFSRYADGQAGDNNFIHFFVPKTFIAGHKGYGHTYILATNTFQVVATKYLYINDTYITGHADNQASGTANGITYTNTGFVLRYVIGV